MSLMVKQKCCCTGCCCNLGVQSYGTDSYAIVTATGTFGSLGGRHSGLGCDPGCDSPAYVEYMMPIIQCSDGEYGYFGDGRNYDPTVPYPFRYQDGAYKNCPKPQNRVYFGCQTPLASEYVDDWRFIYYQADGFGGGSWAWGMERGYTDDYFWYGDVSDGTRPSSCVLCPCYDGSTYSFFAPTEVDDCWHDNLRTTETPLKLVWNTQSCFTCNYYRTGDIYDHSVTGTQNIVDITIDVYDYSCAGT